ncbi:hypothetical protein K439DRAFT_1640889 [Ramaria rubella]|nr:hypothetical protein K439DRAFT_1640889 [Ramaria rubella]
MIYWLMASFIEDRGVYETLHARTWMDIRNRYGSAAARGGRRASDTMECQCAALTL